MDKINFLTHTSFYILAKISCIFNQEIILIYNSNRSCIRIYIFHALNVMDSHEVSCLIIVWCCSCYFSSLCRSNFGDVNLRKILSRMIHFPLLSKIIYDQTIESHLSTIQYNSFCLFLCPNKFINTNDSTKIPDITKDNNIIFETIFLSNLSIDFINVNFIIKFVTHLNQMVSTRFFIDQLSRII